MHIELGNINDILNIDELIDNSFNGTCFAYSWFLKLKQSNDILKIYNNNELQGFMPIFTNTNKDEISQSTMYIPYGGPVIFKIPKEERNKIRYIRSIEKVLCEYIKNNYNVVDFSIDNEIIDIMPFIRAGFTPEVRYTYKIDLTDGLEQIYNNFGSDRKKDIRRATKNRLQFVIDSEMKYFSSGIAMKWESNYGFDSTADFVTSYIKQTINHNRGMCFIALDKDGEVLGAVHIAWDKKVAYILYSYYKQKQDDVAIAFLYYKIFEYFINNKEVKFIDFEGSVFEAIENWNISFGAYQSRFYNLHWNKKGDYYLNLYNYGEK